MREDGERGGREWSVTKRWARRGSERGGERESGGRERVEGECSGREG